MLYKILYTKSAFDDIKKLDIIVKKRIKKKIEYFSEDPISHAKKLIEFSIGTYRWRIGDYRVIFDIDGSNIVILRIKHRRESYK
jgi:mRNA interferase RelE/StbE